MNGPSHFAAAERLLERADALAAAPTAAAGLLAAAQVHATLALAASQVDASYEMAVSLFEPWDAVLHPELYPTGMQLQPKAATS